MWHILYCLENDEHSKIQWQVIIRGQLPKNVMRKIFANSDWLDNNLIVHAFNLFRPGQAPETGQSL